LEADWHASRPFLACGLPQTLLDTVQQIADEMNFHLVGLTPQFVALWNRWRKQLKNGAWLGIVHGGTLTLGAAAHGHLQAVRTAAIPVGAGGITWLREHLAREAMRLNLPAPQLLQLCGAYPADWITVNGALTDAADNLVCAALERAPAALGGKPVSTNVTLAASGMRQ
jgi:hypothetical protein